MNDIKQFNKDRNEALLSMNKEKIIAYLAKYGQQFHSDDNIFWAGVHKARTAIPSLPFAERMVSKRWLDERGLSSFDDGDLSQ